MSIFEKAKRNLKKMKKEFPEYFEAIRKAAPGEPVAMPKELSNRIRAEHVKNVSPKLDKISFSAEESEAHAHESAPKIYC